MNDEIPNAADPEFLLSKSLDERLDEADRARLDRALPADATLAGEARSLQSVAALLKRLGKDHTEIDWVRFETNVRARVTEAADERSAGLGAVDRILGQWATGSPIYDEKTFAGSVMREVRRSKASPLGRKRLAQLGYPLAIAASILFALTVQLWIGGAAKPVSVVQFDTLAANGGKSANMLIRNVVVFDTTVSVEEQNCAEAPGVAYLSVGSGPATEESEEVPPL